MTHKIIKAETIDDVESVSKIYDLIHQQEEAGIVSIGWKREIYPIRETALHAFEIGMLFVCRMAICCR